MKKKIIAFLLIFVMIACVAAIYFGVRYYDTIKPNNTIEEQSVYYQTAGDEVALFYNSQLQTAHGIYSQNEVYLPINWVDALLNDKFYYDNTEDLLVYTLPDNILYADLSTTGNSGRPLIIKQDDKIYLSIGLINTYTDIYTYAFTDADVKRIYIDNADGSDTVATVKKNTKLRTGNSVKDTIVADLNKGENVTVVEDSGTWLRVRTASGQIGYVEAKRLENTVEIALDDNYVAPEYTSIHMDEPVILAWHQVTTPDANQGLSQLLDNAGYMNVISPTWYKLSDNNGNYTSLAAADYVVKAHERGLQVWPLIDNFSDAVQSEVLLSSTKVRRNLIEKLMNEAKTYDFDGYNLDFESLKKEAGPHYIQFIRELSVSCRKEGLVLSVDNPSPADFNKFYDRAAQAEVVDYVINMGYDEHYAGGEMGSVASYDFVKTGIDDCLTEVPKEKLINAVPFYTRVWTITSIKTSSQAYGIAKAQEWIDTNGVEIIWDDTVKQYYGEYATDNDVSYIWMEEEKSLGTKMQLIKDADLAGVACWKLGLEPSDLWGVIDEIRN